MCPATAHCAPARLNTSLVPRPPSTSLGMRLDFNTVSYPDPPSTSLGMRLDFNTVSYPDPPSTSLGMGLDFNTVCTMCGVHSLLCIFLHIHGNGFNFGKTMQSPQLRWFLFLVHDVLPHGYYAFRKCFSRYVSVSSRKFSKKKYKTNRNQNKSTSFTRTIITCSRDTTQLGVN